MTGKRSWIEIDLCQLKKNYGIYKSFQPEGRGIMAVVKADAYGHGDTEVSAELSSLGVDHFAVSNIDEALHVRRVTDGEILILGYTPVDKAGELVENNITQTLLSEEYAEMLLGTGLPVRCQFAIDTGMRRIGLNADHPEECERVIRKYSDRLTGLFTHLCVADTPSQDAFTDEQIGKFRAVCERVADLGLSCHCMNSAGGLRHTADSSFVRLGIVLYGLKPDYENELPEGIAPVLSWKSVVSMVKEIKAGDTVGYGRTFAAEGNMTVATIPTGYADGYSRLLSNKGYVLVNGRKAPIVGRVCMDQMTVDVTGIPDVDIGTQVVLIGGSGDKTITADDLAHMYGTIGYEIVCGINKRVKREFLR
ncbi:MAG: alanine racemase [Clostridia bacterium]|nr:alanine racemase [Clostridia bacterium]